MNRLNNNSENPFVELSAKECKSISGGDNITQAVFNYFGAVWAGIKAGQPHASYGYYAGMNTK